MVIRDPCNKPSHMVFKATRKVSLCCLPKECWQAFLPTKLILEITFYMFTTVSTKKVVSKNSSSPTSMLMSGDPQLDHPISLLAGIACPVPVCIGAGIPGFAQDFCWSPVRKFVANSPAVKGMAQLLPVCVLRRIRKLFKRREGGHHQYATVRAGAGELACQ